MSPYKIYASCGGVGKSQVAGEFVWLNLDSYEIVLWLRAGNKAVLADDFSAAGTKLLAPDVSDQARVIDILRDWLSDTGTTPNLNVRGKI
jgi:hypothetical protein